MISWKWEQRRACKPFISRVTSGSPALHPRSYGPWEKRSISTLWSSTITTKVSMCWRVLPKPRSSGQQNRPETRSFVWTHWAWLRPTDVSKVRAFLLGLLILKYDSEFSPVVCLIVIIIWVHVRHLLHIVSLALTCGGQSQTRPRDGEMSWFRISDVGLRRTVE